MRKVVGLDKHGETLRIHDRVRGIRDSGRADEGFIAAGTEGYCQVSWDHRWSPTIEKTRKLERTPAIGLLRCEANGRSLP